MGSGSERMIEEQERQRDLAIAELLGLEPDEYDELGGEIDQETSADGLVYGTYIVFPSDADPDLLAKVKGLDGDRVLLPSGFLDSPEPPEED